MKKLGTILIVEDSEHDIELTLSVLKQYKLANDVEVTRDGGEALDYLYRRGKYQHRSPEHPIVIFLDLKMPKVDGLQVLKQVKGDVNLKMIPIVMLTSSREETDLLKSYQLGVNSYVVKPVGFDQFVEAIRQLGMFWAVINEVPAWQSPDR